MSFSGREEVSFFEKGDRMAAHDFLKARTGALMIVDDAAGLKQRVDGDAAHVAETAFFELQAYAVGKIVACRNSVRVAFIDQHMPLCEAPQPGVKGTGLLLYGKKGPGVGDQSFHLAAGTYHARFRKRSLDVLFREDGEFPGIEAGKAASEDFSFLQHQQCFQVVYLNVSSAELTRSASFSLPINAMVLSRSAPPATPVTASRIGWKSFP